MKVLYICAKSYYFAQGYSGRVVHAQGIVEGLLQNNCQVEIISGPGISDYFKKHKNLKITSVGEESKSLRSELFWRRKLLKYLKANIQENELTIIRYGFSHPLLTLRVANLCKKYQSYSIVEVNSLGADNFETPIAVKAIRPVELLITSQFDKTYVVSDEEKRRMSNGKNGKNILVIPNATNNIEVASDKSKDEVRFVYLGVLHDYYNFEEIVKAFNNLNGSEKKWLVIYGYGDNDNFLRVSSKQNPQIKLMGKYENSQIHELVNRDSDILLLPYKKGTKAEIGSPMKLFEYMILGAPVLASDVGQLKDVFNTGQNGYIYKAGNVQDLTSKMSYLIKHKEERKAVGYTAHEEAIQNHTWKKRIQQLLDACSH